MSNGGGEKGDLGAAIRDIVATIGALATLVIVPGSIALLLRLQRAHLPADLGVVSSLPNQFLLAIGLTYVAAPLAIVIALALVAIIAPGREHRPNPALMVPLRRRPAPAEAGPSSLPGAVLLGLFSIALVVGIPFAVYRPSPPLYSFLLSALAVAAWLGLSRLVARKYADDVTRRSAMALLALVATGAFVAWAIAFAVHRVDFPEATVCTTQGTPFDGILIGETSDRVYVGEPAVNVNVFSTHPIVGSKARGTLREQGYGAHEIKRVASQSYRRTDLLVADLEPGFSGLAHVSRIGVPILGYLPRDQLSSRINDAVDAGVEKVVPVSGVTNPSKLVANVRALLAASPAASVGAEQRERKISSIASSQVTRVVIGSTGPCQLGAGAAG